MKKTRMIQIIIFILFIVLLYFVARRIDFAKWWLTVKEANVLYILAAILSMALMYLVSGFKHYLILNPYINSIAPKEKVNYFNLTAYYMAGVFLNVATPGIKLAGEPVKAYFLSKRYGGSKSRFIGLSLLDNYFNIIVMAGVIFFSSLLVVLFTKIPLSIKLVMEAFILFVFISLLVYLVTKKRVIWRKNRIDISQIAKLLFKARVKKLFGKKFGNVVEMEIYLKKRIKRLTGPFTILKNNKEALNMGLSLASFAWLFNYLSNYFVFLAFDYRISFVAVIIVTSISLFFTVISPTPGGAVIVEAAMISLYVSFGISPHIAALTTVVYRMIYYMFSILAGSLCLVYMNIKYK